MTRFWIRSTLTDEQLGNFSLSLSHIQVVVIKGPSFFVLQHPPRLLTVKCFSQRLSQSSMLRARPSDPLDTVSLAGGSSLADSPGLSGSMVSSSRFWTQFCTEFIPSF